MTIQDFIKKGHKWIELKGVPVRDSHSKSIVFIHNHFFEGKELDFQNKLIGNFMKLCPTKEWSWRVYGGDTPDADMVGWIYTQTAEIVSGDESVMLPESPQEIRDDYKVGDTVKWKVNGKTGIIEAICECDMGPYGRRNLYTVNFDKDTEFPTGVRSLGAKYLAEALEPFEPVEDVREAEGVKVGDKVRHNKHEEVATVTAIREAFVNGCDGYRYLYTLDFGQSVKGPFDVELNGGEYQREAFTLQNSGEIKPKATDSELESLTAKYAKQIEESALLGCGYMVGDGDETRKDSKCVKVRTAYKNDSHDAKDWTYCVSWYETTIKGDADGQRQTLRECENGILLEQAARHMAYFELMARKGWTLDEILYGKAA